MKIREEVKEVKEIKGFYAIDGTYFQVLPNRDIEATKQECLKYEQSAEMVLMKKVEEFQIGDAYNYNLDPCEMNDDPVEIFKPTNQSQLDALNQYLEMHLSKGSNCKRFLESKYIGKEIIISWNYEMDWCKTFTYEEFLEEFKNNYYSILEKYKEKDNG